MARVAPADVARMNLLTAELDSASGVVFFRSDADYDPAATPTAALS